jgi:hypothetical protein
MKALLRNIIIGTIIWIIGVSVYSFSFYISILENAELQANLLLTLAVLPLVWFGAKVYYKQVSNTKGVLVGLIFFLTAAFLDAVITVPYLIIPHGGSYNQFFTDLGFWLIGLEFIAVTTLYWYLNISIIKQSNILK